LEGQNKLTDDIDNFVKTQLIPYLEKVPSSVVAMKFRSGESLIPNTDNERDGEPLEPGELSKLRKEYLEQYLNTVVIPQIQNVDKQVEIPQLQYEKVEPKEPWIGKSWCKTPTDNVGRSCLLAWKERGYPDRDKYNLDQVSEFSITVSPKVPTTTTPTPTTTPSVKLEECASTIRVRFEVSNHDCQNAEFFVFANSTRLNNLDGGMTANLNTGTKARGIPNLRSNPIFPPELMNPGYGVLTQKYGVNKTGKQNETAVRYDDFEISFSAKKDILAQSTANGASKPFINLWFECTTDDAHDDIVTITVYDGQNNVIVQPFKPAGKKEGLLCTLNECGKRVETTDFKLGPSRGDVNQARKQLIDYKSNIMSTLGIAGDTQNLDAKGLSLEQAGALLREVKEIATEFKKYTEAYGEYLKVNPNPNLQQRGEIETKYVKPVNDFIRTKIRTYFNSAFKSPSYQEILRKNPMEPNSYRRGIMTSDMGGDLRVRMDEFYKFFNIFFKLNENEDVVQNKRFSSNNELNKKYLSTLPNFSVS
jgi:hypothetical protein